ncbi:MAG: polysaccharide biosynthesis tyrosine autokinase [Anaerolineae bacterium]|nr:polysaccharide biosynthesis tyrosine autokinase [Anaerolineae bacterium]
MDEPQTSVEEAALARLQTQLREIEVQHNQNFNGLEALRISQARETNKIEVFQEALPNNNAIRPRPQTNATLAATVGALLALGIIFLIDYLDDTVKNPEQVAETTGLSTLGAIAFIKGSSPNDRLITVHTPRAPVSEAYRVLRTNLNFAAVDGELKSLLVTSSSPSEGKSTTTANLAVVLAQTGKKVCIVDADLRRPMQHKIFATANNHGLTTALLDAATPVFNHIQSSKISGLSVMTSGPIPPNPAELLNSQRMAKVLEELGQHFEIMIFDSPPTLTVADASILAPQVDGCVLVIEGGKTRLDALIDATERLEKSGAHLLGVVMNQLRTGRTGYYDYYYYRYYSYDYSSRRNNRRGWRLTSWLSGLGK